MTAPTLPAGPPPENAATPATSTGPSLPGYVQESSRLNKVAAWVGIVAGSLFIVVVIFGSGFFLGKHVGDGPRGYHHKGHEWMLRPGSAMPPTATWGQVELSPGFAGPFGPRGPMIEVPRPPGSAGGADGSTAPGRP